MPPPDLPTFRSWLFVPGDRPDRMVKALASGADALILDLEDAVAGDAKPAAREAVARFLDEAPADAPALFVRVNPLDSGLIDDDLAAVDGPGLSGIVLPKSIDGTSAATLIDKLGALGASPSLRILPIATETAQAVFGCGTYGDVGARLAGLTWGAEDLPAAIGATAAREADGRYTPVYEVVRTLALMGAHAARVAAIETVYPAFRDLDGLAAYAARGRRDGFSGMMAIHPAQVPVINRAFAPGEAELARAEAIVALFAANPGAGALAFEGAMVDAPHLAAAKRVLAGRSPMTEPKQPQP